MLSARPATMAPRFQRVLQARYFLRLACAAIALFSPMSVKSLFAQTYLQDVGVPPFSTQLPVEHGFVNAANGNLHIEIPLGSFPQRGGGQDRIALMYDSAMWTPYYSWYTGSIWEPINIYTGGPPGAAGWRLVTSGDQGAAQHGEYDYAYCSAVGDYGLADYTPWIWIAPDGTQHSFNAYTTQPLYPTVCSTTGVPTSTAYASDGSGFYISIANYTEATVYAPDGTAIGPLTWTSGGSQQIKADPNGNQFKTAVTISPFEYKYYDTLNRIVVDVTASSDFLTYYYAVPNAQGGTSTYTLKTTSSSVHTGFGYTGWSEYSGTLPVVTEIDLPDGTNYQFSYDTGTGSGYYGLMKSMTLPTGGTINYDFDNHTDVLGNVSRWISHRTTPDSSTAWSYGGPTLVGSCPGYWYLNCQQSVTVQKPSGDSAKYTFALNGGSWLTDADYYNSSSSSPIATTSACYNFVTLSSGTCSYSATTGSAATNVYRTAIKTTLPISGGVDISKTTEYTWDSSNNGNVTSIAEWDSGSSLSSGADRTTDITYYSSGHVINRPHDVKVNGGAAARTVYTYDGSSLVTSGATGIAQHDDANYDSSFTSRGNLTQVQRYIDSSTYLTSSMTYDITGQMRTSTDFNSNLTTYSYGDNFYNDGGNSTSALSTYTPSQATNAYLTSVTKASGTSVAETSTFGYYWGTGQTTFASDPNSQPTYFHFYDSLNRPTNSTSPDGGWKYLVYPSGSQTQVDVGTGITSTTLSTSCSTSGNDCRQDQLFFDSLGRSSSQVLYSDPDGATTVATAYDQNGRATTLYNPYRSSVDGYVTLAHDGLDRVTQVTKQDGSVAYTYYGSSVSSHGGAGSQSCSGPTTGYPILKVDEAGNKLQSWIDGFGRTIEVDEPDSGGTLSLITCYAEYDLNNNLEFVQSAGSGQSRTFTYDFLSRPTAAAHPESGTTSYYYTTSGGSLCSGDPSAVCRRTDARGITTTYSYDALNRLTGKSYSDSTPTAYYNYDQTSGWGLSLSYTKGRLTTEGTYSGSTNYTLGLYSYDKMGRIALNDQSLPPSIGFSLTDTYNLEGDLTSIDDINSPWGTLYYSYDSAGRPTAVTGTLSDSQHPATLASVDSSVGYYPFGAVRKMALGNGLTEATEYESRFQPCRFSLNTSGSYYSTCTDSPLSGTIQDYNVVFGGWGTSNNGNVTGWVGSGAQTFNRWYNYDTLNRLSSLSDSTSGNPCPGLSWSYDVWGNRTNQTVTSGTCGSWSAGYNSSNHITNTGFVYDSAGNLTNDGSHTYFYDAENHLIQIDGTGGNCSTATACYTYDAEGRRVERTTGGVTTYYAYDAASRVAAEVAGGSWTNGYVYFNGQLRAIYDNIANTTRFVHQDHLGSTRLLTNMSGCVVDNLDYLPFGELLSNSPACTGADTAHKFTGYERDPESGLDYAQARYYSSAQGRFMSPDPLGGDIGDPQSLNRYAYVRNNPLTLVDPTGMDFCIDGAGCGGCDFCFDFSYIWDPPPPPPPVYNPPNPSGNPNPPAGDPTGPIWQEINLPMQPFNLAALLGIQMPSPFIINNIISIDQNGSVVSDTYGEELSVLLNNMWTSRYWNGRSWVDSDALYLQQFSTQVVNDGANENFIFTTYGLSVLTGAGGWAFGTYGPAVFGATLVNLENVADCATGALSPSPGGPGLWGNACSAGVNLGQDIWKRLHGNVQ